MKVKLLLAYDGGPFGGWQKQTSGKPTIQGLLEQVLSQVLNQPIPVTGSGRTDAGVHALGQVAHFICPKPIDKYNIARALTSLTPPEIVVHQAWVVPKDFHAMASAQLKTYKYLILNSDQPSAFRHKYTAWVRQPLNLKLLNTLSQELIGHHDFKSFQTEGTKVSSTQRHIYAAKWVQRPDHLVEFTITGNGFLKQMVRNIVGTLLDLERHQATPGSIQQILAARDRTRALSTAPAHGLYLYRVVYPSALDNKCRKI